MKLPLSVKYFEINHKDKQAGAEQCQAQYNTGFSFWLSGCQAKI